MSLDKKSIAQFSDTLRDKLSEETKKRAAYYGILPDSIRSVDDEFEDSIVIGGKVFNKNIKHKREQLVREIREKGYSQVMDEVTYTWFNRFVALKFMEVNGYLPVAVFSSGEAGKHEPDILTQSLSLDFLDIDRDAVIDLKSEGKDEELYQYLILRLCNYMNKIMPFLFESIEDYTELLFPERLLHTDSILGDLNGIIDEGDWKEVEVIGWIYQYYVAPRKERVFKDMKKNIKIKKEDIPAATQLFTPHWIVRYLVENSLGRLWMLNRPHSRLSGQMEYYIKPEQTETDFLRINSPEEIKICDPACGSGHMLVYAFDLLHSIYEEEGYTPSEIPEKILSHNLFGIEIDKRAAELAAFALTMKARKKHRNFFNNPVQPNICALQSISFEDDELRSYISAIGSNLFNTDLQRTLLQFGEADNFGSLVRPATTNVSDIWHMLSDKNLSGNLTLFTTHQKVLKVLEQADYLSPKYHVVIANPPYMGGKGINLRLKAFLQDNYTDVKSDLFSAFIERIMGMIHKGCFIGMMTPFNWMFLSSFEKLRDNILGEYTLTNLVRPEFHAFFDSAYVSICGFTLYTRPITNFKGSFIDLQKFYGASLQPVKTLEAINNPYCSWFYCASAADFKKIPGSPIAYWLSKNKLKLFSHEKNVGLYCNPRTGLSTSDNNRFLRIWSEVSINNISFNTKTHDITLLNNIKWYPCQRGGGFRRWYGLNTDVLNWECDGDEIKNHAAKLYKSYTRTIKNIPYYFKPGLSWSYITSGKMSLREFPIGHIIINAGPACFFSDDKYKDFIHGYLNSNIANELLTVLAPTMNFDSGPVSNIPIVIDEDYLELINSLVQKCKILGKYDWDSFEISWDFQKSPLLLSDNQQLSIKEVYIKLRTYWREMTLEMQRLEEENNRIFIDAYGLQDEMTPNVPLSEITLTCNPHYRYKGNKSEEELEALLLTDTIKEIISYAVGCMFGRYSPDKPGLILANQGETINDFKEKVPEPSFMPDDDNIIPILDDEYFPDDIVGRFKEFLKVTFGTDSLAENLEFIAGALSKSKKSSGSPEKVIRDYFLKSFFKDHVKMYKKRPIYWLFTSGKGRGFNALVYMHRYDRETLAKMRTDYLLELEAKLDARIGMLRDEAAAEKGRLGKQVEELIRYDEVLNNMSLQMIDIDLDDGVKVNYAKFEGLVGKV